MEIIASLRTGFVAVDFSIRKVYSFFRRGQYFYQESAMRKVVSLIFLGFFNVKLALVAEPAALQQLVAPAFEERLNTEGSMKLVQLRNPVPSLVTGLPIAIVNLELEGFKPAMMVESLYLYKKPAKIRGRSWTEEERLALYNSIRALSTLSGIEYYSASRKRMRVFYERSYLVDGSEGTVPLPDPIVMVIPDRSEAFAIQKDLTFGENRYRYVYAGMKNVLYFVQVNMTAMNYGIVPILGKEKLRTIVIIADTADDLLVYSVSAIDAIMLPGIEGKVRDSFSNRADAVFSWFQARASSAFAVE